MTGRPPFYPEPALMEAKIDQYFDRIDAEGDTPTVAELSYELGFATRNALWEYEQKPEFSDTIKRARLRIEVHRTKKLVSSGTPTAGLIFDLCNNHGYQNPQHLKHSGDEDGKPIKTESSVKADESVDRLLEELHRLKAGSAQSS